MAAHRRVFDPPLVLGWEVLSISKLQIQDLQERLGYRFRKPALLRAALTHSSYANEAKNRGVVSNERLEFLGDSVLGMCVAVLIYKGGSNMQEGKMTRLRSELVCEKSLAALAVKLGIGECLLLGRGEEKSGGRERPSILADAVEAILAAIYLDGGFEPVMDVISEHLAPHSSMLHTENSDYKTALQEIVQEKTGQSLSYMTTDESGPDHMKRFTVEVYLNGICIGAGAGKSKKEAEQSAAKAALCNHEQKKF